MSINLLELTTDNYSTPKAIYPYIIQVGTGGTGGYLVQHIAQMLGISKHNASYTIVDPDVIENKNLGNQLFLAEEVGLKKADVLASRYSEAYGVDIGSYSEAFIESVEQLNKFFTTEYLKIPNFGRDSVLFLPIIIGCVDNHYTRKILHEFFEGSARSIYIDAGNESTTVPSDWQERPKKDWTAEELHSFNESGWTGQVVTGVKLGTFNQAPVAEVFPDILMDNDSIRPSELSCTELSASEPQRLIVNKFAAMTISNILSQIVEEATITTHLTCFHTKTGYMRSTLAELEKKDEESAI